jgi:hypothetical protein
VKQFTIHDTSENVYVRQEYDVLIMKTVSDWNMTVQQ